MELAMSGPDIEARARAVQEQNRLVQKLRDSGNDTQADLLQETYHAREMSGLAADVYLSAKKEGEPPAGWTRASDDPQALRDAGIDMSDEDLRMQLSPRQSGFRAEIYIPDKRVFGDQAKPVVVFKGSTGEIIDASAPGGRRESGPASFIRRRISPSSPCSLATASFSALPWKYWSAPWAEVTAQPARAKSVSQAALIRQCVTAL